MPTRWPCLALLLLASAGCHSPGHGPTWDAWVRAGQLSGDLSAEEGWAPLSFQAEIPGPADLADGPVLVLIHGWCGNGPLWGALDELPWSQRNMVSLDLPGHGASAGGLVDPSLAASAAGVARLIDHLGLDEAVLVGHGLGAQVALLVASLRPQAVRGVVAVEGLHDLSQEYTVEQAQLMEKAFRDDFAGTMHHYLQWLVGEGARASLAPRLAETLAAVSVDTALGTLQGGFLQDVRVDLVTLPVPLVLLNGDQRPTHLPALRELIPFATVEVVPDAGHFPHLEQPGEFGRALDRALATIVALWEAPR